MQVHQDRSDIGNPNECIDLKSSKMSFREK